MLISLIAFLAGKLLVERKSTSVLLEQELHYLSEENLAFQLLFLLAFTVWNVSVFGVVLVCIFAHSDWIRRDTENISIFSPKTGKCRPEKSRIRSVFTHCLLRQILYSLNLGSLTSVVLGVPCEHFCLTFSTLTSYTAYFLTWFAQILYVHLDEKFLYCVENGLL